MRERRPAPQGRKAEDQDQEQRELGPGGLLRQRRLVVLPVEEQGFERDRLVRIGHRGDADHGVGPFGQRGELAHRAPFVREHLTYRVVDRLENIEQAHSIRGLLEY